MAHPEKTGGEKRRETRVLGTEDENTPSTKKRAEARIGREKTTVGKSMTEDCMRAIPRKGEFEKRKKNEVRSNSGFRGKKRGGGWEETLV